MPQNCYNHSNKCMAGVLDDDEYSAVETSCLLSSFKGSEITVNIEDIPNEVSQRLEADQMIKDQ